MYIIGERLNTSIPEISKAVKSRDKDKIIEEACAQVEAGEAALDINAGTHGRSEEDDVLWMMDVVTDGANVPLSLDSSNAGIIEVCLNQYKGPGTPIINSINGEAAKLEALTKLIKEHHCDVIALAMDERGIPDTAAARLEVITKVIDHLENEGIARSRIYADPLVIPVSTDTSKALCTIETLQGIKKDFPEVKTIVGLSNISFGLPKSKLLNRTFLAILIASGLDAAILDPTMPGIMPTVKAAEVLLNHDEFCTNYLSAYRSGKLEP
ncbi:MAG: dihydropteroate synthase [Thermoplasmata archaeon]|nr:MAG: dihydropteroate synthase [Thermoplasmata archaeon]